MTVIELYQQQLEQEAPTTRTMLGRVPEDKYDWRPHPKSMAMLQLATHIAELPSWVSLALTTDELDFAETPYKPEKIDNNGQLLHLFERSYEQAQSELREAREEQLGQPWTLREGEQIYAEYNKSGVIRMAQSQLIHHRAQLGVYLRLLDIPIPGSYGPSADEQGF